MYTKTFNTQLNLVDSLEICGSTTFSPLIRHDIHKKLNKTKINPIWLPPKMSVLTKSPPAIHDEYETLKQITPINTTQAHSNSSVMEDCTKQDFFVFFRIASHNIDITPLLTVMSCYFRTLHHIPPLAKKSAYHISSFLGSASHNFHLKQWHLFLLESTAKIMPRQLQNYTIQCKQYKIKRSDFVYSTPRLNLPIQTHDDAPIIHNLTHLSIKIIISYFALYQLLQLEILVPKDFGFHNTRRWQYR